MAHCIAKANEVCPEGYRIDSENERSGVEVRGFRGRSYTQNSMRITCKE